MKKIKKKLLTAMLYTICYRNVDKLISIWIFTEYDLLGGKQKMKKMIIKLVGFIIGCSFGLTISIGICAFIFVIFKFLLG